MGERAKEKRIATLGRDITQSYLSYNRNLELMGKSKSWKQEKTRCQEASCFLIRLVEMPETVRRKTVYFDFLRMRKPDVLMEVFTSTQSFRSMIIFLQQKSMLMEKELYLNNTTEIKNGLELVFETP